MGGLPARSRRAFSPADDMNAPRVRHQLTSLDGSLFGFAAVAGSIRGRKRTVVEAMIVTARFRASVQARCWTTQVSEATGHNLGVVARYSLAFDVLWPSCWMSDRLCGPCVAGHVRPNQTGPRRPRKVRQCPPSFSRRMIYAIAGQLMSWKQRQLRAITSSARSSHEPPYTGLRSTAIAAPLSPWPNLSMRKDAAQGRGLNKPDHRTALDAGLPHDGIARSLRADLGSRWTLCGFLEGGRHAAQSPPALTDRNGAQPRPCRASTGDDQISVTG